MQFQYKYFLYLINVGVSDVTVMLILGKQASVMSETISKKKNRLSQLQVKWNNQRSQIR